MTKSEKRARAREFGVGNWRGSCGSEPVPGLDGAWVTTNARYAADPRSGAENRGSGRTVTDEGRGKIAYRKFLNGKIRKGGAWAEVGFGIRDSGGG